MSPQQTIARLQQAIAECDRYINKEAPRSADLRPPEIQVLLDGYIAHRAKLQAQIDVLSNTALEEWSVLMNGPAGLKKASLYSSSLQDIIDRLPFGDAQGSTVALNALVGTYGTPGLVLGTDRVVRGPDYVSFTVRLSSTGLPKRIHVLVSKAVEKVL